MADAEHPWAHLKQRDGWDRPDGADDDQVLLMTTCMETWITSDRVALRNHYGACLKENALPKLNDMESRPRGTVQSALIQATRTCPRPYAKGKASFELVGQLDPAALRQHLPSFVRCERVIRDKL